jgi:ankyrin repeat protein
VLPANPPLHATFRPRAHSLELHEHTALAPTRGRSRSVDQPPSPDAHADPSTTSDTLTRWPGIFDLPAEIRGATSSNKDWSLLPPELKMEIAHHLSAVDLTRFGRANRETRELSRSPAVITRQSRTEGTQSLWRLAWQNDLEAVTSLIGRRDRGRLNWAGTNPQGATLLMNALQSCTAQMVRALLDGPAELGATSDIHGSNVLHYAVARGDPALLDQMIAHYPILAGYVDRANHTGQTPMDNSYDNRDQACFAVLNMSFTARIDALLTSIHDPRMAAFEPPADGVIARRVTLACRTITHRENAFFDIILASLPRSSIKLSRGRLLNAVVSSGNFPALRTLAGFYGAELFAPLAEHQTILHLVSAHPGALLLHWLLARPSGQAVALARNAFGQTPLLQAAEHGNIPCMEALAAHYPAGMIEDVDHGGHGLLQTCLWHSALIAQKILNTPRWAGRLTCEDLSKTLGDALEECMIDPDDDARTITADNLTEHITLIRTILRQPPGVIDVYQNVGSRNDTIIEVLRRGDAAAGLAIIFADEQADEREKIENAYASYDSHEFLGYAAAHEAHH